MSNTQRPKARELKIQETYCLPCMREAKEADLWNVEHPDEIPKKIPVVGIAVTWEVTMTPQGMPLGPYPVCSFHLTVTGNQSRLVTG